MKHGFSFEGQKKTERKTDLTAVRVVRAELLRAGTTLAEWARENGVRPGTAHNALTGRRDGPRSRELRRRLMEVAGLVRGRAHVCEGKPAGRVRQ